ncbi:MAG: permease prefix domain 1-containing protein [Verrucomicrobiota bacterium]
MSKILNNYLDQVVLYANRSAKESESLRDELKDHLETGIEARVENGESREDAIYEAIMANGDAKTVGHKLRPRFPLIDIRSEGIARGFIAIGPRAVGVFAAGGVAVGVVSFGAFSVGLISIGGLALGLFGWGGLALAVLACGGFAAGAIAVGGMATGLVAIGGQVFALWSPSFGNGYSYFTSSNVPEILSSLEIYAHGLYKIVQSMNIVLFFYFALLALITFAQVREKRRVDQHRRVI